MNATISLIGLLLAGLASLVPVIILFVLVYSNYRSLKTVATQQLALEQSLAQLSRDQRETLAALQEKTVHIEAMLEDVQ